MKKLFQVLFSPLVLGTIGLLLLSLLIGWAGPLLAFGAARPFEAPWVRVALVVVIWAIWIGVQAWKAYRRRRTNAALLQGLGAGPSAADKEAQVLAARFNEAVQRLKSAKGKGLFGGGLQLYELPWYVFVGAPGSGKTTALMNAGLQFLVGDAQGGKGSVQGVGGTRNCEWWFTQDAVLIDTAGRYATQESDKDVDASAWDNFLALLKKTRPRQPINGVLLTVNVQDLLQQGSTERVEHAAQLRARLNELQAKLGVRAPVYVLVTKADLIGGFNETFEGLAQDDRNQVWGFTFDAATPAGDDPVAAFPALYQQLQQRLVAQLVDRLEGERDVLRRSAIFAFPQEFAALQAVLGDFLRQVFSGGGTVQTAPRVRGVYFSSGTQEGSPIDRVMGSLAASFGMGGRSAAIAPGRGKSFFLHRLLKDLVFAERGLGALDPVAERRRHVLRLSAMGTMGVLALLVAVGWAVSRARNLDHAAQVAERLPALRQAVQALPPATSADVAQLPAPLAGVRDAARLADFDIAESPLLHALGLYQGDKLDAGAQIAYHRLLERALMPRVARRLEERLRAANKDNLENAYEALKSYVMLHQPERFDAAALQAWVGVDWDANYARMAPEQRAQLDAHLAAALALGAPKAVLARDDNLVASVREMLAAYPLEYRVYSRIKRQYRPGSAPDFTLAGAAGPNAAQAFERRSGEPLTRGVSGLYTRDGYRKLVLPAVQQATPALAAEEGWVLGLKTDPARLRDAALGNALGDKVRRLYFEDYIKVWDAYLADVQLVKLGDPERALAVSRLLAAVDSPLAGYLRGVAEQTRLVQPAAAAGALDQAATKAKAEAARLAGAAADTAGGTGGPLERMVDDHFAGIHRLVTGDPPPLTATLKLFGDLYAQLAAVDAAKKSKSPPPPPGGAEQVKVAAAGQPELVRGMVEQMADAAAGQTRGAEREGLTAELKPITDICNRAIGNRYPFASGSRADVLPEDFGQLFGVGGLFDEFFQRRLVALVDQSTKVWTYRPLADGSRPVSPAALAEFQRAQRIREVFFRSGGKTPAIRIEMRLSELEPSLKELNFDIDGAVQKLTSSGPSITINWPSTRVASVMRMSTGLGNAGPLVMTEGPWALFRLFERFQVEPGDVPERFSVIMNLDGKRARLEVTAASVFNPFQLREIKQFRCPAAL
ncbi:MAG: type VI secretion system membrane subunit TssM [Leptothrix sp. (in: Bacteria)]|nr:type VI secretion system membrane subunit TssM [Leptothrix sp. (in: b-proteobacteria)]